MINYESMEALDEALDFLNEASADKKARQTLIATAARALKTWAGNNGIANVSFSYSQSRLYGGAKANKEFKDGKSKYFVIGVNGVVDSQQMYSSTNGGGGGYSTDTSGLNRFMVAFQQNKKSVESFVSEKIDRKVAIKVGDSHAVTGNPTLIVTLI